jgi:GNAT superfamily N-acetyltransferase
MEIAYRCARPEDAPTIVGFQIDMALETESFHLDPSNCSKGVRAVFERPDLGTYHVATEAGRLVGSLLITYEWSDWRNRTLWWIQSVYVRPECRRHGVYRGLYDYVRRLVERDAGVAGIRLYVDTRNSVAQQAYARLGMNGDHYRVFEWMK